MRLRRGSVGYLSSIIVPLNAPNLLTLTRIGLVPAMALLIFADHLVAAAAVFAVAAVTDAADGHLARSRNLITAFGRIADPLADKLLVGTALVALVAVDRLAMAVAVVVLAREAAVSLMRWHAGSRNVVIAVSGLGKAKTAVQMTAIVALMLVADPWSAPMAGLLVAVVAITVASGVDYALTYLRRTADAAAPAVTVARP